MCTSYMYVYTTHVCLYIVFIPIGIYCIYNTTYIILHINYTTYAHIHTDYQNDRAKYEDGFIDKLINWEFVSAEYDEAVKRG